MPIQVSFSLTKYSIVGNGVGEGTMVSVAVGSGVRVSVGVCVGVSEGVVLWAPRIARVRPKVRPAASRLNIARRPMARGMERVIWRDSCEEIWPDLCDISVPHTAQRVAFSPRLVPHVGHIRRPIEVSSDLLTIFFTVGRRYQDRGIIPAAGSKPK
jgi:hypothetical protein